MLLTFSSQFPNPLSHKETQVSETGADTEEEDHLWREWMKTVSSGKQRSTSFTGTPFMLLF